MTDSSGICARIARRTEIPPTPESPRGLYAYDLATGSSTLVVPDAIEMLEPGPRRFTMGDFLRR